MHSMSPYDSHPSRASYLEEVNRGTIQALQLVLEMGRQGTSLNRIDNPRIILQEVRDKVDQLIPSLGGGFVFSHGRGERGPDHGLVYSGQGCPVDEHAFRTCMVEERTLSLVLQRSGPFFIGVDGREVLMHAMNTVSRC